MPEIFFSISVFIFGCLFGSFANVLILRIPKKALAEELIETKEEEKAKLAEDLSKKDSDDEISSKKIADIEKEIETAKKNAESTWWKGRSHCPHCKNTLKPIHLIPIISYFLLGRRCGFCNKEISPRYAIIEFSMGLLFLGLSTIYSFSNPAFYFYTVLTFILFIIAIIDFETMYIFDRITYPWTAIFFAISFFVEFISWQNSLAGFIFGFGSFYLTAWLFFLVTKKHGLGGGDIKLMGLVGAALGIEGILFTIFIGSLSGAVLGLLIRMISPAVDQETHPRAFPFGPFLCLAAIIYIFTGKQIMSWYFGLM